MMRLLGLLIPLVCLYLAMAPCLAGSGDLSFQCVVKEAGKPFHGTGQFKFALFNADGGRVWANDGGTGTGEPGKPVSLAVENGTLSVLLGPATGMAALDPALFQKDLSLRVWFSKDGGEFEQLAPDQPLARAPYAAVSALSLESRNAKTLEGFSAEDFAPAAGRGFVSGLPIDTDPHDSFPRYYLRTFIDGQPAGRLVSPLTLSFELQETYPGDSRFPTYPRGGPPSGTLTLWQLPGSPMDWNDLFVPSVNGEPTLHTVEIVLTHVDASEVCRWRFPQAVPIRLHQTERAGGVMADELTFSVSRLTRERGSDVVPVGKPGVGSTTYQSYRTLVFRGVEYAHYWVADSLGASVDIARGARGEPIPGRVHTRPMVVRQNPTAEPALFDLFAAAMRGESPEELIDVVTRDSHGANVGRTRYAFAWPYSYRLLVADDGLPVEELRIIADRVTRP